MMILTEYEENKKISQADRDNVAVEASITEVERLVYMEVQASANLQTCVDVFKITDSEQFAPSKTLLSEILGCKTCTFPNLENVSDCSVAKHDCMQSSSVYQAVRALCPQTCHCHSPTAGLFDLRYCPSSCQQSRDTAIEDAVNNGCPIPQPGQKGPQGPQYPPDVLRINGTSAFITRWKDGISSETDGTEDLRRFVTYFTQYEGYLRRKRVDGFVRKRLGIRDPNLLNETAKTRGCSLVADIVSYGINPGVCDSDPVRGNVAAWCSTSCQRQCPPQEPVPAPAPTPKNGGVRNSATTTTTTAPTPASGPAPGTPAPGPGPSPAPPAAGTGKR